MERDTSPSAAACTPFHRLHRLKAAVANANCAFSPDPMTHFFQAAGVRQHRKDGLDQYPLVPDPTRQIFRLCGYLFWSGIVSSTRQNSSAVNRNTQANGYSQASSRRNQTSTNGY